MVGVLGLEGRAGVGWLAGGWVGGMIGLGWGKWGGREGKGGTNGGFCVVDCWEREGYRVGDRVDVVDGGDWGCDGCGGVGVHGGVGGGEMVGGGGWGGVVGILGHFFGCIDWIDFFWMGGAVLGFWRN